MPLANFGLVSKTQAGSCLYRSAQPDYRGLIDAYDMGIRTIFKLNDGFEAEFKGVTMRAPLAGWALGYDTDKIVSICQSIKEALNNSHVLLHCTEGRDRSGMCAAAFRLLYDNATLDEVNQDRKDFGQWGIISFVDYPENSVLTDILARRSK